MKVYNSKHENITTNIRKTLSLIRTMRGFNADEYITAKITLLNEYMSQCSLSACVVAVSGGIDSSAVLGLIAMASKIPNSPIKKIIAISLPAKNTQWATNQVEAIHKAKLLCSKFNIEFHVFDINNSFNNISAPIDEALKLKNPDLWARGQLVAYTRTPFLYYTTSVLTAQGFSSIIVGTTNRDEGAYLGYVGKASDGMVDIQLISDLHKSEVYSVSEKLQIINEITTAIPAGDMYDGRTDEEVFGAPYDFVEIYLNYKNISINTWEKITSFWEQEDQLQFDTYQHALEKLHKYNQHKYWAGSQAIHLDILDSSVTDGWIEGVHSNIYKKISAPKIIPTHNFIGYTLDSPQLEINSTLPSSSKINDSIISVENLIDTKEIISILNWKNINNTKIVQTNQYGIRDSSMNGSKRLSFYSIEFAKIISERILLSGAISNLEIFSEYNTNWKPFNSWRFVGVNPMIRLLNYSENDFLVPHYDDSFYESNIRRSLLTLIISISNQCIGGSTQFLFDSQNEKLFEERDFSDLSQQALPEDINFSLKPKEGSALIFPHRILHSGELVKFGEKIILRTELMFEACTTKFLSK